MSALAPPISPFSAGSLMQLTLSLAAILALIFALGWLLKKFKLNAPQRSHDMAVLDQLSVGPRERIALIRVGSGQVLVGIGANGIVALAPLSDPLTLLSSAPPVSGFAERLRELMKRSGNAP